MKLRTFLVAMAGAAGLVACSGPSKSGPAASEPAEPTAAKAAPGPAAPAPAPAPAAPKKKGPIAEQAQALREAADQLDKAQTALENDNKNLAEQLFSTAEILVGPEALAAVAKQFRDGAPPRVTTPTIKIDTSAAAQPKVAGSSEAEDEKERVAPPRVSGSLTGTMQIDGRAASGAFGLVTLEPAEGKWKPRSPKRVVVEQRGREFLPRLTAISVGSTVSFPNFDGVFHNVFSISPTGAFDLGIYKAGEARDFTFPREGIVRVGCNLHANMSAYIAVVSAPAYVVTDDAGRFSFRSLAPGKYKLRAWSERSKAPITQEITIKAGKNEVTVGVAGDAQQGAQPDKFGGKRG